MNGIERGVWIGDIGGVDLDTGELLRKRAGEVRREPLDTAVLVAFTEALTAAHALGDRTVRMDQFVDGAWVFAIRLDGRTVRQAFEGETGRVDAVLQPLFDRVWRG